MPSVSSGISNEKRATPELTSVPTSPISRPVTTMHSALRSEPEASTTAPIRPTIIREKYSAGPNVRAISVSGGANAASTSVATVPAKNEPRPAAASAAPARPFWAILWPSMTVTTDDASPGKFTRMAVVEPPYCEP
ncbi:hypothetical protein D9M68_790790 [compost metagenome]